MRLAVNPRLLQAPILCLCYAHIYAEEGRVKHAARGIACVYLGLDETSNSFRVKEWITGKIYFTADVVFHPSTFPYVASPDRTFADTAPQISVQASPPIVLPRPAPLVVIPRIGGNKIRIRYPTQVMRETVAQGSQRQSDQAITRSQQQRLSLASTATSNLTLADFCLHAFGPDPLTWEEALASPYANEWIAARALEMQAFKEHEVLELVRREEAAGCKIFKAKVVMKVKTNPPTPDQPLGSIDKVRYRLTIAAFTRMLTQGIDYKEKFASTVRWNSILVLLAIAAKFDYDISLFDMKTFFLNGKLEDSVFMEQAPGWEVPGKPRQDWICKVNKSMYGLPQAAHCAQLKLNQTVTDGAHLRTTTADDCVHVTTGSDYAAIGAHVDDIPSVGTKRGLQVVHRVLSKVFEVVEVKDPTVIMGVQIIRDRPGRQIKLHQSAFISEILAEHGMAGCATADTPITPGMFKTLLQLPTEPISKPFLERYQQLVGSLLWLTTKTRFDMSFCVNVLCRFLKCATEAHYTLARGRPLRYLRGTLCTGLVLRPGIGDWVLSAGADADFAGDFTNSRSMMGSFIKLGDFGTVSSGCYLERKIATSPGHAETYAMQSVVKDVTWFRHLLSELQHPQIARTTVTTDNDGVRIQSTKPINYSKARHFRVSQAYVRGKEEDGTIDVQRVDTDQNPADLFTKPLHSLLFVRHRNSIMGPDFP